MISGKKQIRSLKANLGSIPQGTNIIVGVKSSDINEDTIFNLGFTKKVEIGETILPNALGSVSNFNANGKNLIHKDQPMETAYRTRIWDWNERHGKKLVPRSKIVDVPYDRYPRTFIKPPSIELKISKSPSGHKLITSPLLEYDGNDEELLHVINLFLELFQHCQFYTKDLDVIIKGPIKKLNWEVLPRGRMPWKNLVKFLRPVINTAKKGNRRLVTYRFEVLAKYGPDFTAIGQGGFTSYVVFGFEDKGIYIFESAFHGNATYVFDDKWEELSMKTKAEILDDHLQKARIIHRTGWTGKINELMNNL